MKYVVVLGVVEKDSLISATVEQSLCQKPLCGEV